MLRDYRVAKIIRLGAPGDYPVHLRVESDKSILTVTNGGRYNIHDTEESSISDVINYLGLGTAWMHDNVKGLLPETLQNKLVLYKDGVTFGRVLSAGGADSQIKRKLITTPIGTVKAGAGQPPVHMHQYITGWCEPEKGKENIIRMVAADTDQMFARDLAFIFLDAKERKHRIGAWARDILTECRNDAIKTVPAILGLISRAAESLDNSQRKVVDYHLFQLCKILKRGKENENTTPPEGKVTVPLLPERAGEQNA